MSCGRLRRSEGGERGSGLKTCVDRNESCICAGGFPTTVTPLGLESDGKGKKFIVKQTSGIGDIICTKLA